MKTRELSPSEVQSALQRTHLAIVFAGHPSRQNPMLQAAHGETHSFVILRHQDEGGWDGWELTDASKEAREEAYRGMLRKFQAEGALCTTPDGRAVEL
jgi:hypothetical protein